MERLCIKYYSTRIHGHSLRVCMPGMVYDIEAFEDKQAFVNGIWVPDNIFSPTPINDLTMGDKGE